MKPASPDPVILARLQAGASFREIADELGVHIKTVRNRYGHLLPPRPRGGVPHKVNAGVVIAHHHRGLSQRRIAREMGISVAVVRRVLASVGLAASAHAARE